MTHAAWNENRNGELFFVEADNTASGWVFSERSTYEVRWYQVRPKDGWIEKAAAIVAQWAKDHAELPPKSSGWVIDSEVELGDYCDNASALAVGIWRLNRGEVERGLSTLIALRTHLVSTADEKSRHLLLPTVEETIEKEFRRQKESQCMANSNGAQTGPPSGFTPIFAGAVSMARYPTCDVVSRFKLHMIDVVAIVTALAWTHTMLVHEISMLPGLGAYPAGANVVAGSVLAVMLRLVSKAPQPG
jgi:hypothetical protein